MRCGRLISSYISLVTFLVLIFQISSFISFGQEVTIEELPFETFTSKLGDMGNYETDFEILPNWRKIENHLEEKTLHTLDTSWWTPQIFELVKDWKTKNSIQDDGEVFYAYSLFVNNKNEMLVEKLPFKTHYLFDEIGGGYNIQKYLIPNLKSSQEDFFKVKMAQNRSNHFNPEVIDRPLVCVFDTTIELSRKKVKYLNLTAKNNLDKQRGLAYGKLVPRNISIQFKFGEKKYEIQYSAIRHNSLYTLGEKERVRTEFKNNVLKLINVTDDFEQIIYKMPDDQEFSISDIGVVNINDDQIPDVVLSVAGENGKWNLVYLSKNKSLEYVGYTEVYFIAP